MFWFKFEIHEYMDMYPEVKYQLVESEGKAKEYAEYMNSHYSGGVTTYIGPATKEEILNYIQRYTLDLDEVTLKNVNNNLYYL